jgi:hypothetical protein
VQQGRAHGLRRQWRCARRIRAAVRLNPIGARHSASDSERFLILENDPLAVYAARLPELVHPPGEHALRAQPGEDGEWRPDAFAGERIGYRVSLPFAASLPTRAWIHDAGSRDVRWRLVAAGTDARPGRLVARERRQRSRGQRTARCR